MSVGAIHRGQVTTPPRFGKLSDTQKVELERDAAMLKNHAILQKAAKDMSTPELIQALDIVVKQDPDAQSQSRPFGLPLQRSNPLFKILEQNLNNRLIDIHTRFSKNTHVEEAALEALEGIKRLEDVEHYEIQDKDTFEAFRAAAVRARQVLAQHKSNAANELKESNPFYTPATEPAAKPIVQPLQPSLTH